MGKPVLEEGTGAQLEEALEVYLQRYPAHTRSGRRPGLARDWRWALEDNPFAGSMLPGRVFLARLDGRPVGVLLGVPAQVRGAGLELPAYWGTELYVLPDARGRGVGQLLLTAWRDAGPLALGLGVTPGAFRLERSLGWQPQLLPPRACRPLSPRGACFLGRGGWRLRTLSAGGGEPGPEGFLPADSAALLEPLAQRLPWHVARTEGYLRWRYLGHPAGGFGLVARRRGGALTGLSVYRLVRRWWGIKAYLYELLCDPADEEGGRALVGATLEVLRKHKADVVEGRTSALHLIRWLEAEGFEAAGTRERFIVYVATQGVETLLASRQWYLTLGDSGNP